MGHEESIGDTSLAYFYTLFYLYLYLDRLRLVKKTIKNSTTILLLKSVSSEHVLLLHIVGTFQ